MPFLFGKGRAGRFRGSRIEEAKSVAKEHRGSVEEVEGALTECKEAGGEQKGSRRTKRRKQCGDAECLKVENTICIYIYYIHPELRI